MKKVLAMLLMVIFTLTSFIACKNNSVDVEKKYSLTVLGGDENCNAQLIDGSHNSNYLISTKIEIVLSFNEGFELAYLYMPNEVAVDTVDNRYYIAMPNQDVIIMPKSQKVGEIREKKSHRFELNVLNGGLPFLHFKNDYYNEGDKISMVFRPNSEDYKKLKWISSTGLKYDYENFTMPNHDLTLTAVYEK